MLLKNYIVNNYFISNKMSNNNSPLSYRKKIPKHPSVSFHNRNDNKLNKVTSVPSNIAETDYEKGIKNLDSSNDNLRNEKSNTSTNSNGISRIEKFMKETTIEKKNSNRNFNNNKKQPNDFNKIVENRSPQMVEFNRKLEKESELVGMLGKQLYIAENQMQRMQVIMAKANDRMKEKEKEIAHLKRKVRESESKLKNQEAIRKEELVREKKQIEDSEYLYRRCLMLEHKIYEMEKFLADYGLVWVGDTANGPKSLEKNSNDNNCLKNCYTQLVANIEELNMSVGKGEVHVQRDKGGGGASFKTPSCMSLKFYKNGLVIQNGRIRSYEDPATTSFIRDILDGYFPSELQQAYPNGVPFKVEDHRTETFHGRGGGFPGHGYRLGKIFSGGNQSFGSSQLNFERKQNIYNLKSTVSPSLTTNYTKSMKSKNLSEAPPSIDMTQLRSQILASHNNNCSDSHIQSHINAELVLSSRIEKKRELATKDTECHISVKEKTLKSKADDSSGSQRFLNRNGSRVSNDSSTNRSLDLQISPGRLESTSSDDGRSRLRSTSLPGRKIRLRSLSKLRISSGNSTGSTSKTFNNIHSNSGVKIPRASRSVTLERKPTAVGPLLHQVNKSSEKAGELKLKIRSLNGSTIYLVHLCPDDTVARLYNLLDNCMVRTRLRKYKVVIGGYAPKRLEQLNASLKEYGILRDSVLHIVDDSMI